MGTPNGHRAQYSPHRLVDVLTADEGRLLVLVNGYRSPDVLTMVHGQDAPAESLFAPEMGGAMGPQLVEPNEELTRRLVREGWGQRWAIYLRSESTVVEVATHLRGLVTVAREGGVHAEAEDGSTGLVALRLPFYEPAILRPFLCACTPRQSEAVFGPITAFMLEHEGGRVLWRASPDNPKGEIISLALPPAEPPPQASPRPG